MRIFTTDFASDAAAAPRYDSTLTCVQRLAIIPAPSCLITRVVAVNPSQRAFAVIRRWLAFGVIILGLFPVTSLFAQTTLGSFQLEHTPADSTAATIEYGWSRAWGVAQANPAVSGPTLDSVSFLHWVPNPLSIRHDDPNDPARHVGLGHPLVGTSWRNRPFHIGWLFGGMFGDQLIGNRISQDEDMFGGYRLGWDFDHYWGAELRLGFSNLDLTDTTPMLATGSRTSRDQFWDLNLMYYPWGDSRWRPFVSLGFGAGNFYFKDEAMQPIHETVVTFPLSMGIKYYRHNWLAWRASLTDQWSLGAQGLSSMHNVALTVGVEVHFGGTRVGYFPVPFWAEPLVAPRQGLSSLNSRELRRYRFFQRSHEIGRGAPLRCSGKRQILFRNLHREAFFGHGYFQCPEHRLRHQPAVFDA